MISPQAWQSDQARNFSDLRAKDGGLDLAGDCRSDSPGHCAKYGSYSLIEDRVNKVVDVQLVQCIIIPGPATHWFIHASFNNTSILHLQCYVMFQSSEDPQPLMV
ncbi:hypothetical protein F2P79_022085 [Pimephales promelas]|nr:hypothetical protein F2P79_022085 [Pimephales promelas]